MRVFIASIALLLAACAASGSAIVTGATRPAISTDQVQIYSEPPSGNYEVIGIVSASSVNGWTDQQDMDLALAELKQRAAAIGANGVLLEQVGRRNDVTGSCSNGNCWMGAASSSAALQGRAIYVAPTQ